MQSFAASVPEGMGAGELSFVFVFLQSLKLSLRLTASPHLKVASGETCFDQVGHFSSISRVLLRGDWTQ